MVPPGQGPQSDSRPALRLRVPAEARYTELVRLAVTGVAARSGCRADDVDRLSDEVVGAFDKLGGRGTHVVVTAEATAQGIDIELARRPGGADDPIVLHAQR